jgi:hypothetical protein
VKWGLGRKAQWLVEELNAEHLLGVARLANSRGGRSSEALRVQSSRFGHLGGPAFPDCGAFFCAADALWAVRAGRSVSND